MPIPEDFVRSGAVGIVANVRDWLRLIGHTDGQWIELQALDVPDGRYAKNKFAHACSAAQMVALLTEAERWGAPGVYLILNRIDPAVATRAPAGQWHDAKKGESTTDSDITHRLVLYVDFDAVRPRGTSATDAQVAATVEVANRVRELLIEIVGGAAMVAMGMSGNGTALLVALAALPETPQLAALVKGILAALHLIFTTDQVVIDTTVSDAKRLGPAWGTTKRKGAKDVPERPHRATSIAVPSVVERLSHAQLDHLLTSLLSRLSVPQRAEVERAMGKKATAAAASTTNATRNSATAGSYRTANDLPIEEAASRLGLIEEGVVRCPGCSSSGDSSVAFVGNGLKCSHNRCKAKGVPGKAGYRTVIDLVCEVRAVEPAEAVRWLAQEFGIPLAAPGTVGGNSRDHRNSREEVPHWRAPVRLDQPRDLPAFPVRALPDWLARYVDELSHDTQTPPDMAGLLALAAVSVAVAKHVRVDVRSQWIEPVNIYVLVISPPGTRKSSIFSEVNRPLVAFERSEACRMAPEIEARATDRQILERTREHAIKKASTSKNPEEIESWKYTAQDLTRQLAELPPIPAPALLVDDITPETMATVLFEQNGRAALMSPEGGPFEIMAGRYSSGAPNFEVFLKGHAGDELRVRRRGRTEYVEHPAVTMGLTVQPDVVRALADKPGFRGRGLLGRFLYSYPINIVGRRSVDPAPITDITRLTYERAIATLLADSSTGVRAGRQHSLTIDDDGQRELRRFCLQLEPRLGEDGDLHSVTDWASKLAGAVVRVAGLVHMATHYDSASPWDRRIGAETIRRAVEIGEYLIPHARAAFAHMGADPAIEDAQAVLRWLERQAVKSFTTQEIWQATKGRFKKVDPLHKALAVLVDRGYLHAVEAPLRVGPGRKAAASYLVNPHAFESPPYKDSDPYNRAGAPSDPTAAGDDGSAAEVGDDGRRP